jgi:Xaa-Pro aminopeptidase
MSSQCEMQQGDAIVMAGIPSSNADLYRRIRFLVGDPVAYIRVPTNAGDARTTLILRDIEMHRARQQARADQIACPADFEPAGGLSGDRETATAQAAAVCLCRAGVRRVWGDRTLPLIFADLIRRAGIEVICNPEMGIIERRCKDDQEIQWLRQSQQVTEQAVQMACEMVARASVDRDGGLVHENEPLTSERLRTEIDVWLLRKGFAGPPAIVAGGPAGADCHNLGSGRLHTQQPVIIDVFPQSRTSRYYGDCTRTVVHGVPSERLQRMHEAVVHAKAAALRATRAGVTGEAVHQATTNAILEHGFAIGLPADDAPVDYCAMIHGTGHGVGLDVHEPPLLDKKGPPLLVGDALTIEPGLYCREIGGIRVEDMVIVTEDGCENLNQLPEGLRWD